MSVKAIIKHFFWGRYFISELHWIESKIIPVLIPDKIAVIRYYKSYTGSVPNLDNPKSFTEKLQWYKLNHHDPLMQKCADKVDVRQYVTDCGYSNLLNELYKVYSSVNEIKLDELPNQFVLKSAHGSQQVIIVKDKAEINWRHAKLMMRSWLKQDIYWSGREWVYKDLKRRIVAEKYLEDSSGGLRDYKFFCFNGVPRVMQYESGRFDGNDVRLFFDMDWNQLPFGKGIPFNPNIKAEKPNNFVVMKDIAADLCKPFQFVRVDLYESNNRVYFGELTFFPAGGMPNFDPPEYDDILGSYWELVE